MKNIEMKIESNHLIITVDLNKEFGPSSSGKNIIVATSEGNQTVPGREEQGIKIGVNVYKRKTN